MKRSIPVLIVAFCVAGPNLRGGTPAQEKMALQGTWQVIQANIEGMKVAPLENAKVTFTADRMKLVFANKADTDREFSFEIDPSKNPKEINLVALNGPLAGTKGLGIYKIDKDVLTLVTPNKPETKTRPTKFESEKGSGVAVMVLKKGDGK